MDDLTNSGNTTGGDQRIPIDGNPEGVPAVPAYPFPEPPPSPAPAPAGGSPEPQRQGVPGPPPEASGEPDRPARANHTPVPDQTPWAQPNRPQAPGGYPVQYPGWPQVPPEDPYRQQPPAPRQTQAGHSAGGTPPHQGYPPGYQPRTSVQAPPYGHSGQQQPPPPYPPGSGSADWAQSSMPQPPPYPGPPVTGNPYIGHSPGAKDYYQQVQNQSLQGRGFAIAALVMGAVSLIISFASLVLSPILLEPGTIVFGLLPSLAGLILGIVGVVLANRCKMEGYRGGLRTAGLVLCIVGIVFNSLGFLSCALCTAVYGIFENAYSYDGYSGSL